MDAWDRSRRLYFKEMEILVNDRIEHGGNGKGRLIAGPSRRTRYRVLNCCYKEGSAKAAQVLFATFSSYSSILAIELNVCEEISKKSELRDMK